MNSKAIEWAPLSRRATATVGLGAMVFLAVVITAIFWSGISGDRYFRDPAATYGFSPFAGAISNLGVLILVSAGVICVFSAFHVQLEGKLLASAGAFSLIIAADDLLMLHEQVLPGLGLPEKAVLLLYGVLALTLVAVFRRSVSDRIHVGLYTAVCFLAASVLVDQIMPFHFPYATVIEDSLKFIGLVIWAAYWIGRANRSFRLENAAACDDKVPARVSQGGAPKPSEPTRPSPELP